MDESMIDDEQAKHFIGNLLHEDDSFSSKQEVRNVPKNRELLLPPTSFTQFDDPSWMSDSVSSSPVQAHWSNGNDFFFKPNMSQTQYPFNGYQDYSNSSRYPGFGNMPYGSSWQVQPKPMAAVPPFHPCEEDVPSTQDNSPVSESVTSDSGTISPEPKGKTKWKKFDIAGVENVEQIVNPISAKQQSELAQLLGGKTYSSVAQQPRGTALQNTGHKRVSGSNSVPLSKPSTGNKKNQKGKTNVGNNHSAVHADDLKPSKIVGLNPISPVPVVTPISRPVVSTSAPNVTKDQTADFQKIKRKKGKTSGPKTNVKNDTEQKPPSRFLALAQQPQQHPEGGVFDDEEDDCEYLIQIEEQKEEMRAKARAELAACNSTDAEKVAKMQKLEIDMKLLFASKRRQGKTKTINRQRVKRAGYTLMFPDFMKVFYRMISKSVYWFIMFVFNLICDVAERSVIASVNSVTSFNEMFKECTSYVLNTMKSFVSRIATEVYEQVRYATTDDPFAYQIGLLENCRLPGCCEDIIERLYSVHNADAYSILGLVKTCSEDDILKHYKTMREYLKPELHANVGLSEALLLIDTAFSLVSSPSKRKDYDASLEQLPQTYELQRDLDDLRVLVNMKGTVLHCDCGDIHPIIRAQNHPGRFCSKDNVYHPPKNGDIWVEKHCFGFLRVCFSAVNGAVYDISKWNDCSANRIPIHKTDLHNPAYRFYSSAGSNSCLMNNGVEKHRCSLQKTDGSECIMFSKDAPIPVESLCCCNLAVCSIPENVILQNVPCCFGVNLMAFHTASASSSAEKSDDRARRAGRRRLVRR